MEGAMQVCGLCLGFLGCVCAVVSLQVRSWKVSTDDESIILAPDIYENLWMSCADDTAGHLNCWYFPSLFALPGYIQVCRALMIAAIVLGALGLIFTLVGMQCSRIGGENYLLKSRLAFLGGIFFILQGLCITVAVSWYASSIVHQFYDLLYPGTKYELGLGLYIGWSSAMFALTGGCCLLCSCGNNGIQTQLPHVSKASTRIDRLSPFRMSSSQHKQSSYV